MDSLSSPFYDTLLRPNGEIAEVRRSNSDSRWVIGVDPDVSGALALLKNDDLGCNAQVMAFVKLCFVAISRINFPEKFSETCS